ncbi:putative amidohydrolase [Alkalibacillus flavidus]|uniref:Amidohydrolase n=1 Tax=Alkalibacillus flavidus TaxID=546021 RepID=A0ABV2KTX1_9BACI
MKWALCQIDIVPGDPEANRKRVAEYVHNVMQQDGPDVIVLPEMWTTAYTLPELKTIADMNSEPTKGFLIDLAKTYHVNIIGGSIATIKEEQVYNTALTINREGNVLDEYDKIHLVPMLDEPDYLTGGGKLPRVVNLDGVNVATIICYDLRFPEITRQLALNGADVLCVVAEWPDARSNHWQQLQIARAIENQYYVLSANRVGQYNNIEFAGRSMAIDPLGDILLEGDASKESILRATTNMSVVKQIRQQIPVFESRAPDVY